MLIELRGLEVYDRVATTQMTQEEYYRLLVDNRFSLLFDIKLEGQTKIAEMLSNKENNLYMSQSRLSAIIKVLEVL